MGGLGIALVAAVAATMSLSSGPVSAQDSEGFPDTDPDAFYAPAVDGLNQWGIFDGTGCGVGFCPDEPLDRATMAVWTVRVVDRVDPPAVVSTRFRDVDASHPYASFIERMAELGVTKGCGDGTVFCPGDYVKRAEMAAFISRAFDLAEGSGSGFVDVPAGAWYAPYVAKLSASGVTRGCAVDRFCPEQSTSRGEMATFLARAVGLVDRPEDTGESVGTPATTQPANTYKMVAAGDWHICALATDDTITCWGNNNYGQADPPTGTASSSGGCSLVDCRGRGGCASCVVVVA